MNAKFKILTVLFVLVSAGGVIASMYDPMIKKTLSQNEIEKKWGKAELDLEKFKNGKLSARAEMAHSIVKSKDQYIGKSPSEIRNLLGFTDGHFVNENFPAYVLEIASKKSPDTWQLVFLVNKDLKVDDVVVLSRRR